MRKRKVTVILVIALLILLAGCGGTSGVDDVPPSNSIESSQTPAETPETPTEPIQDPPKSENPTEPTQEPEQEPAEEPGTTTAPSEEPTTEPTQEPATPPAITAPSAPVHTHSYNNSVTKQATCDANGIITYTCSCGDSYTEAIKATGHNYSSTIVTVAAVPPVSRPSYTAITNEE